MQKSNLSANRVEITVYGADININITLKKTRKIMKKITLAILMALFTFSITSADMGVRVGVSGLIGLYETSGKEVENGETSTAAKEEMMGAMGSVFIEKQLSFLPGPLKKISIGYDHVVHKIETGVSDRTDIDASRSPTGTYPGVGFALTQSHENSVSATLDNINTVYATLHLTDWLYVKTGAMEMDLRTTESLESGSTYGNTSLDGTMYGFGLNFVTDGGIFTRIEWNDTSIDGHVFTSETNADNKVTLNEITGTSAKVSIGKAF